MSKHLLQLITHSSKNEFTITILICKRRQLGFLSQPEHGRPSCAASSQLSSEILTTRRQEEQASSVSSIPSRLTPNMTAEECSGLNVCDEEMRRKGGRGRDGWRES